MFDIAECAHYGNVMSLGSLWLSTVLLIGFLKTSTSKQLSQHGFAQGNYSISLAILLLFVMQCIVHFNTAFLYSSSQSLLSRHEYTASNCESAMNLSTCFFYLGEGLSYFILSTQVKRLLREHDALRFSCRQHQTYQCCALLLHLYIAFHVCVFVHPDRIRAVTILLHQGVYGELAVCVFEEHSDVLMQHCIVIAVLLYALWLLTASVIHSKMKHTDAATLQSEWRRILFFIFVKCAVFNVLTVLYIFHPRNASLLTLCHSFLSNSCIYYVVAPESKAGKLWRCVHRPIM